jgi:hypothetical protein
MIATSSRGLPVKIHPVSMNRARASFLSVILFMALVSLNCGCGATAIPAPRSLTLEDDLPRNVSWCHAVSRAHNGPHVYKCEHYNGHLFFTAFEQCGVQKEIDDQAIIRQLVVGLGQLERLSQTTMVIKLENILRTIFRGTLDADHLLLATLTSQSESFEGFEGFEVCPRGLVVWRPTATATGEAADVKTFTEDATMLVQELDS